MVKINKQKYLKLEENLQFATEQNDVVVAVEGTLMETSKAKYLVEYLRGIYETKEAS